PPASLLRTILPSESVVPRTSPFIRTWHSGGWVIIVRVIVFSGMGLGFAAGFRRRLGSVGRPFGSWATTTPPEMMLDNKRRITKNTGRGCNALRFMATTLPAIIPQ